MTSRNNLATAVVLVIAAAISSLALPGQEIGQPSLLWPALGAVVAVAPALTRILRGQGVVAKTGTTPDPRSIVVPIAAVAAVAVPYTWLAGGYPSIPRQGLLSVLAALAIIAFVEETVFRVLVPQLLERVTGGCRSSIPVIAASAILFAFFHLPTTGTQFLDHLMFAFLCSWIFARSKDRLCIIVLHFCWNTYIVVGGGADIRTQSGAAWVPLMGAYVILGAVVTAGCGFGPRTGFEPKRGTTGESRIFAVDALRACAVCLIVVENFLTFDWVRPSATSQAFQHAISQLGITIFTALLGLTVFSLRTRINATAFRGRALRMTLVGAVNGLLFFWADVLLQYGLIMLLLGAATLLPTRVAAWCCAALTACLVIGIGLASETATDPFPDSVLADPSALGQMWLLATGVNVLLAVFYTAPGLAVLLVLRSTSRISAHGRNLLAGAGVILVLVAVGLRLVSDADGRTAGVVAHGLSSLIQQVGVVALVVWAASAERASSLNQGVVARQGVRTIPDVLRTVITRIGQRSLTCYVVSGGLLTYGFARFGGSQSVPAVAAVVLLTGVLIAVALVPRRMLVLETFVRADVWNAPHSKGDAPRSDRTTPREDATR